MENYYLFLDESGDHGLSTINPVSPVFLLCGILVHADEYQNIKHSFNVVKHNFWGNKEVIFHSRDIRKCEKEFQILFDLSLKADFYQQLNNCISTGNFKIIASAINKTEYLKKHGLLSDNVYELCLSFIIERAIFCLDDVDGYKKLFIILEKRGKKEDKKLEEHFQRLMSRGTGYVTPERLQKYSLEINFRSKKQNVNGLQLADLVAYPTVNKVIYPNRANPAYDVIESKFYQKNGKVYGLKVYP